jgi:DNA gyrase subunit A
MATREEDFVARVFVVNTHTPVLFFSSTGMVYKTKVYKLPLGSPQSRGKALVNLLPLDEGETITTMMPLPEDEETWGDLFVVFATASGNIRRNRLSDFTNVKANGKIAMKLNEGDSLVRVRTFSEDEDVLLSTWNGKCIRFPLDQIRVFAGRASVGVRGIRLGDDDRVIGMSGLAHREVEIDDRDAYLQSVSAARRLRGSDYSERADDKARDEELAARLEEPKFKEMAENEEFILTLTEDGMGKRTSAYEYRTTNRGGQGITAISLDRAGGERTYVAASFPVLDDDQMVMVSNGGQLIRIPVGDISIVGRTSRGVTLFKTAEDERVVSVSRLRDVDGDEDEEEGAEGEAAAPSSEGGEDAPSEGAEEAASGDEGDGDGEG